ncbi:MAG: hypothetical protein WBP57_02365 [Ignavibacteria bacterium]|nr:MAG: hypothetical protein EDM69_08820 [Chlorobiota bacterium]MBV6399320.1 hypothetical protein [Ignavibacteria bacterium]MCC6886764.1 hypothetical protein [Ignavibacteriales bacterium]MCE7953701.1 hypothetical protein [Chlorobi bacterium CHB7]RIK48143.1 MAG: hypothetical protein DCC60_08330 [Ignavibacteriota bacterium]
MGKIGVILAVLLILIFILNRLLSGAIKKFSGKNNTFYENRNRQSASGIDRSKMVDAEFEEIN